MKLAHLAGVCLKGGITLFALGAILWWKKGWNGEIAPLLVFGAGLTVAGYRLAKNRD